MVRVARVWIAGICGAVVVGLILVASPISPALAAGTDLVSLDAGDFHTCVARTDGTAWCWGWNEDGEIGDGTGGSVSTVVRATPTQVRARGGGTLLNVAKVTAGYVSTCALLKDRTVRCWGNDAFGQLGDGTTGGTNHKRLLPVPVKKGTGLLHNVRSVTEGRGHTCAALTDGSVWCWGYNLLGELGDGTTGTPGTHLRLSPVRVRTSRANLTHVVAVSAGDYHTCALTDGGSVWCWGYDNLGQAGDGTTGDFITHLRVVARQVLAGQHALSGVTQIAAAGDHTCARRSDSSAWCWGENTHGQMGDGTTGNPTVHARLTAVRVHGSFGGFEGPVAGVGAGVDHSCATETGGRVACWGDDDYGQLGDGSTGAPTTHDSLVPFAVIRPGLIALTGIRVVSGGTSHSCALGPKATVWCWGVNSAGELGQGIADGNLYDVAQKVIFP